MISLYLMLGGAPTWAIGVVGLYAGSAQQETGQRPRHLIEEISHETCT